MPLQIVPFTADHVAAVRDFNGRLARGGVDEFEFPETPEPNWLPGMELFVATEDGAVRGGYILRRQQFRVMGEDVPVAHYRLPLSEGAIDRKYATLGLRLVRDALAREPRLYALGMSGMHHALPQMLKRLAWRIANVPFYFKVVHPFRFLREIRALRTTPARRLILDIAAYTGAGWLGLRLMGHARHIGNLPSETARSFAGWSEAVWEACRDGYALLAERDSKTLDAIYPPSDERFLRIRAGSGWAVLLDTAMEGHKQFGSIRVGTIVDCLAHPDDTAIVVRAAISVLEKRGVDLIVSNQLNGGWAQALAAAGFHKGPSNFLFAASPALAALVGEAEDGDFHVNRGDGDGPIHL